MTCIVGVVKDGKVYIGGDSAGVAGYSLVARADSKVFVKDKFVFGFTSSFRMGQVLRYAFTPPVRHPDTDIMEYMVTSFIDGLRTALKAAGFAARDKEQEMAGTFLVGYEGRLFHIYDDYQVGEGIAGYDACGCGEDIARGALYATPDEDPHARITKALQAAETFSAGVRAPFLVLSGPVATEGGGGSKV